MQGKNQKNITALLDSIEGLHALATDTENNTYWKDRQNPPKLSNGEVVSHSNYMRIAWALKGVEYISNDLLGIGYGRNVFGHAIEKYEKKYLYFTTN